MTTKLTIIAGAAAVVFDLIACLLDHIPAVYTGFMALCFASFCVLIYGLFRTQYPKKKRKEKSSAIQSDYVTE